MQSGGRVPAAARDRHRQRGQGRRASSGSSSPRRPVSSRSPPTPSRHRSRSIPNTWVLIAGRGVRQALKEPAHDAARDSSSAIDSLPGSGRRRCRRRSTTRPTSRPRNSAPGMRRCSSRSARPPWRSSRAWRRPKASRCPRQHNTFYYLSGIETPGAYLLLDGRTKKVTIYLPARNPRLEAAEGRVLSAEDAELVKRISGADEVRPLRQMVATNWPLVDDRHRPVRSPQAADGADSRRPRSSRSSARPRTRGRAAASWSRRRPRASTTPGTAPDRVSGASSSCCARATRAPRCATSTRSSTRCGASRARVRSRWCGAPRRSPGSA